MQLGLPLEPSAGGSAGRGQSAPAPASGVGAPAGPGSRSGDRLDGHLGPHYFVRHRRARRYLLRVDVDGRLRITIPRGGSQREGGAFALRNVEWVVRQRSRLEVRACPSIDEVAAARERARTDLPRRLLALARVLGLAVAAVSIRSQRTRWGSCSRTGRISLNWRLALMPDWVAEYVMIHELMHLRRFDHSPKYWALVAEACPRYAEARAWLRAHGPSLR